MSINDLLTEEEQLELDLLEWESSGVVHIDDWRERFFVIFPYHFTQEFSEPHLELGDWADDIDIDSSPDPFCAFWPRGRGKSTMLEATVADLIASGRRQYCLYISETQDQADKHVATIANMLESGTMAKVYPRAGKPRIGKNGSRSWRRSLVRLENGGVIEAIGLDKAVRGQKIDWARPDIMAFDDIDARHDTENATKKKQDTITTSILPSGAPNAAVVFGQNIIHEDSIAHRLSKPAGTPGAADYLTNRIISGPYPAVDGLEYELREIDTGTFSWAITAGVSLWNGFDLDVCQAELNRDGPTSYELESQHQIDVDNPLALLSTTIIDAGRVASCPDLITVAVGVDPSGGAGRCGIIGGGVGMIGRVRHGFTFADYSTNEGATSKEWGESVLKCYHAIGADVILVEDNFGGDMVEQNIRNSKIEINGVTITGAHLPIKRVHASRGKEVRAQPIATLYERGIWHIVGHLPQLESQWCRWEPGTKPSPDRLDADVWVGTWSGLSQAVDWSDIADMGSIDDFKIYWS